MSTVGETRFNNFGSEMVITTYRNCSDIDVYFPEYNWTAKNVQYNNFKNGKIKCPYERRVHSYGYLGEGPHKAYENGKLTKEYKIWQHMLGRCYDSNFSVKHPTYIKCEVCDEWLNFQNFAEWYNENYYEISGERMNLDKDILIKGNKIYGPNSCVFVPQSINKLFIKSNVARGDLPIGVCYNKKYKKYQANCKLGNKKSKFLGFYDNEFDAFRAYKEFKETHIKKIANEYLELIPFNLYQAMIDYEINIED